MADGPLRLFTIALGTMFEPLTDWVSDTPEGEPGWSLLMDINRAPNSVLPWLAQLVGVQVDASLDDVSQRQQIRTTAGFRRGSVGSMVEAAKPFLTGSQTVLVTERDGDAYTVTVATFDTETPDPDLVATALLSQKPGGLILNYVVQLSWTYANIPSSYATYALADAAYTTYLNMLNNAT